MRGWFVKQTVENFGGALKKSGTLQRDKCEEPMLAVRKGDVRELRIPLENDLM